MTGHQTRVTSEGQCFKKKKKEEETITQNH